MGNLMADEDFKSGFITVVGQPNVGKSTLINNLIGEKIAITSRKAQTTRNKIQCILTLDQAQMVFIDTPGVHKPSDKMGDYLNKLAYKTLQDIDVVLFMVNACYPPNEDDRQIINQIADLGVPVLLVINKVDVIEKEELADRIQEYEKLGEFAETVAISAREGTNLDYLVELLEARLPAGPQYYPEDMITDQIEQFVIANLIREQVLNYTHEEVPHSAAVEIIEFTEREDKELVEIRANIYVERKSQKGIIIGKNGQMIKQIGSDARQQIEGFLGQKVFLDLWVKVEKDWREKEEALEKLGYEVQ